MEDWGPQRQALWWYCCLGSGLESKRPDQELQRTIRSLQEKHLRLYPNDPLAYQSAAIEALRQSQHSTALELANKSIKLDPTNEITHETRLEAAAILAQESQAESSFAVLAQQDQTARPWLTRIRGLVRGQRILDAQKVIKKWLATGWTPAAVLYHLQKDPTIKPVADQLTATLIEFFGLPEGIETALHGILETYLRDDGKTMHVMAIPPKKLEIVKAGYLSLSHGEKLVFLYDWNVWGTSKTGLAITTRRVVWKCMWAEPVDIQFELLHAEQITADSTYLKVGLASVDMQDPKLALGFAAVLQEIAKLVNPPLENQ